MKLLLKVSKLKYYHTIRKTSDNKNEIECHEIDSASD